MITLLVCKSIHFLKTPLLVHFLLIRNFWNNHRKPSLLQTTNATCLQQDLRSLLFPKGAIISTRCHGDVMLQCRCRGFTASRCSHTTLKSNHLSHLSQAFWKTNTRLQNLDKRFISWDDGRGQLRGSLRASTQVDNKISNKEREHPKIP